MSSVVISHDATSTPSSQVYNMEIRIDSTSPCPAAGHPIAYGDCNLQFKTKLPSSRHPQSIHYMILKKALHAMWHG